MTDFSKLKALLEEQESFPHDFPLKFIGLNTPAFARGIDELEKDFPDLRDKSIRSSSGGANHALTYRYRAASADDIIRLLERVSKIPDLRVIL